VLPEWDVSHYAAHCVNEPPAPLPAHYGDDGDDEELKSGDADGDLRFFPNACFVQNHHTQQTEVWTIRAVPPGAPPVTRCPHPHAHTGDDTDQEIHVYYGSGVYRDYDLHPHLLLVRNIGTRPSVHPGLKLRTPATRSVLLCRAPVFVVCLGLVIDQAGHVCMLQFDGSEYRCSLCACAAPAGDLQEAPAISGSLVSLYGQHPWLAELLGVLSSPRPL
jgi:hypothetical protein